MQISLNGFLFECRSPSYFKLVGDEAVLVMDKNRVWWLYSKTDDIYMEFASRDEATKWLARKSMEAYGV